LNEKSNRTSLDSGNTRAVPSSGNLPSRGISFNSFKIFKKICCKKRQQDFGEIELESILKQGVENIQLFEPLVNMKIFKQLHGDQLFSITELISKSGM